MTQRTVDLDPDLEIWLKLESMRSGRPEADVIREALEKYRKEQRPGLPEGMGEYRSGRSDVSEREEEFLKDLGDDSLGDRP